MSEPSLTMTADDDDLPRTLRREREAREREARGIAAPAPVMSLSRDDFVPMAPGATVVDFEVPFVKLMSFCIKAVLAAIPALLLLTVMLWVFGQTLQALFPQLLKMKILIYMPQ